jgi:hypothetical protein
MLFGSAKISTYRLLRLETFKSDHAKIKMKLNLKAGARSVHVYG